VLLVLP
jgi:hypothetical protein